MFTLNTSLNWFDQNKSALVNTSDTNNTIAFNKNTLNNAFSFDSNLFSSKWNTTDSNLRKLSKTLASKGYIDFESDLQNQLEKFRSKCVHQVSNQWPSIVNANNTAGTAILQPLLTECVRTFEQNFNTLDTILLKDTTWFNERYSKHTMTDLVIRNMPKTLFVRGLVQRFTTLGLGLILVK